MLEDVTLVAATITMGLMAGVFGLYSQTIMPGLADTDDRTFVSAFQSIDRRILNPWSRRSSGRSCSPGPRRRCASATTAAFVSLAIALVQD